MKHEKKAFPSDNVTTTHTTTGRYSPAIERDDKESLASHIQTASVKENQDTRLEESSTYATVGSAEASMKENNAGQSASIIQEENVPTYALPEKLKPKVC